MTAKDKAKELVQKYVTVLAPHFMIKQQLQSYAKLCALITVDECMSEREDTCSMQYWQEVKEEIEKL